MTVFISTCLFAYVKNFERSHNSLARFNTKRFVARLQANGRPYTYNLLWLFPKCVNFDKNNTGLKHCYTETLHHTQICVCVVHAEDFLFSLYLLMTDEAACDNEIFQTSIFIFTCIFYSFVLDK